MEEGALFTWSVDWHRDTQKAILRKDGHLLGKTSDSPAPAAVTVRVLCIVLP